MKKFLIKLIFYFLFIFKAFSADIYNSSNQQLTIPTVNVNETIYTNVVVTVGSVVSVGGSINPRTSVSYISGSSSS